MIPYSSGCGSFKLYFLIYYLKALVAVTIFSMLAESIWLLNHQTIKIKFLTKSLFISMRNSRPQTTWYGHSSLLIIRSNRLLRIVSINSSLSLSTVHDPRSDLILISVVHVWSRTKLRLTSSLKIAHDSGKGLSFNIVSCRNVKSCSDSFLILAISKFLLKSVFWNHYNHSIFRWITVCIDWSHLSIAIYQWCQCRWTSGR